MLSPVRTTVTLEDDLAARLRERARERDLSFKAVLNEAIRSGLTDAGAPSEPYRMKVSPMQAKPEIDLTKALRLAGELEDEEIVRKLEQGR
jgi:predicted DNA-binding ribbon-helix-helix protein